MLIFSQQARPSAGDVLKHAYFHDASSYGQSDAVMSESFNSPSSSFHNPDMASTSMNSSGFSLSSAGFNMSGSSHNMSSGSLTLPGSSHSNYGTSAPTAENTCINLEAEEEDVDDDEEESFPPHGSRLYGYAPQ